MVMLNSANDSSVNLTISEVEALTGVRRTLINRIIDDGHFGELWGLERNHGRRVLNLHHCVFVLFHVEAGKLLAPQARREVWFRYAERVDKHQIVSERSYLAGEDRCLIHFSERLSVDLSRHCRDIEERWRTLVRSRNEIISDPDVRGGALVVGGTRIGVYEVAEVVEQVGVDEVLGIYPSLTREKVEAAVIYAKAHPRIGRPGKKPNELLNKAHLKSSRFVSRQVG